MLASDQTVAKQSKRVASSKKCSLRFEPANVDSLFPVLDAVAWLDLPDTAKITQFAGLDPRTVGKLLKNSLTIGLVQEAGGGYLLPLAYPYKGSREQKTAVVKEALVKMPLLSSTRQFRSLGDPLTVAVRKAATLVGVENYEESAISPLIKWANTLGALEPGLVPEDLLDTAQADKQRRHEKEKGKVVAFLSHSSNDKPLVRQLAADLTAAGITVWIDEQNIGVGDSIPGRIAQGLAESDYFVIVLSESSVKSKWVEHELNNALVGEMARRNVKILPARLSEVELPQVIADRRYADFSKSYRDGLRELLAALKPVED